jgi:hypothetical protein
MDPCAHLAAKAGNLSHSYWTSDCKSDDIGPQRRGIVMAGRRFPRPWRFEPIPGGYRVIDANGLALAHVYGEPPDCIAIHHAQAE